MTLKLRGYQRGGVDDIRTEYIKGKNAVLYVLATGGGKTVIFCDIAQKTADKQKNVLILVHRVELLRQTAAALKKSSVSHGLINPRYTPDLNSLVQIASVQTLINRLSQIQSPDLIIIDEAHHAIASSWQKIIDYFPNAKILGVTAFPERGDGKGLDNIFDSLVVGPQTADLIKMGYLVKYKVYAPPEQVDLSKVKIVKGDYDKKQLVKIVDKPIITNKAVDFYKNICPGVPTVVFCVSVIHAENVAEQFRLAGYVAYSIDGSMDDNVRRRILNGLRDGVIQVVTSCDIISEGTDIPAITCIISLRPTMSIGVFIQQFGRALRTCKGKLEAIMLDMVGNVKEHGFPDDIREYSLNGREKIKKENKSGETIIKANHCQTCYIMFKPASTCSNCGAANENMKLKKIVSSA